MRFFDRKHGSPEDLFRAVPVCARACVIEFQGENPSILDTRTHERTHGCSPSTDSRQPPSLTGKLASCSCAFVPVCVCVCVCVCACVCVCVCVCGVCCVCVCVCVCVHGTHTHRAAFIHKATRHALSHMTHTQNVYFLLFTYVCMQAHNANVCVVIAYYSQDVCALTTHSNTCATHAITRISNPNPVRIVECLFVFVCVSAWEF